MKLETLLENVPTIEERETTTQSYQTLDCVLYMPGPFDPDDKFFNPQNFGSVGQPIEQQTFTGMPTPGNYVAPVLDPVNHSVPELEGYENHFVNRFDFGGHPSCNKTPAPHLQQHVYTKDDPIPGYTNLMEGAVQLAYGNKDALSLEPVFHPNDNMEHKK